MGAGRRVTDAQVKELRRNLNQEVSLTHAAMKADMDRKTARKYRELGQLPSEAPAAHTGNACRSARGRLATIAGVSASETPVSRPSRYWNGCRANSQSRTGNGSGGRWNGACGSGRPQHGPAKEVFFSQVHEPGRLGSSDFTHMDSLGVTIQRAAVSASDLPLRADLLELGDVTFCFSESFASLSEGLQNALWDLGGVPERHRTDRMTLAVHQDGNPERYTAQYQALMAALRRDGRGDQCRTAATRTATASRAIGASRRRWTRRCCCVAAGTSPAGRSTWQFVRDVVARRNAGRAAKYQEELARLRCGRCRRGGWRRWNGSGCGWARAARSRWRRTSTRCRRG